MDVVTLAVAMAFMRSVSSLENYVRFWDYATASKAGVVKTGAAYGTQMAPDNQTIAISAANAESVKAGWNTYVPIVPNNQHAASFYGLAKAAGDSTQANSNSSVGTYTDGAKDKIQQMLGIIDLIAPHESSVAVANRSADDLFILNGKLYKATANISMGTAIVPGTNCTQTTLSEEMALLRVATLSEVRTYLGIE